MQDNKSVINWSSQIIKLMICAILLSATIGCGSTSTPRSNASVASPPSILKVDQSRISENGESWKFKAKLLGSKPVTTATLYYRAAGSTGTFKTKTLASKNGLDNLEWDTATEGAGHITYYLILEDAEGEKTPYGSTSKLVNVKVAGFPEEWRVMVKKHAGKQLGPGNWIFSCGGKPFQEKFVVKNDKVEFAYDGRKFTAPVSKNGKFKVFIPLNSRASTSSRSDSTIQKDKRALIFSGSLRTGKGRYTAGIEEFGYRGCTAKANIVKV